jgi:hypothetical protein
MKSLAFSSLQSASGVSGGACAVARQHLSVATGVLALLAWLSAFRQPAICQGLENTEPSPCRDWLAASLTVPAEWVGGIVLFNLDPAGLTEDRLAVLSFDLGTQTTRLRISRCVNGKTEAVFSLDKPQWEDWDELESFPSNALVPGVVMWGAMEHTRSTLIVVCYTGSYSYLPSGKRVEKKGTFKIAFQGEEARLVDLDLDGIPEVVANMDRPTPEVWTFVDGSYVKVGAFPLDRLHSADVLNAIRAARTGHGATPSHR